MICPNNTYIYSEPHSFSLDFQISNYSIWNKVFLICPHKMCIFIVHYIHFSIFLIFKLFEFKQKIVNFSEKFMYIIFYI